MKKDTATVLGGCLVVGGLIGLWLSGITIVITIACFLYKWIVT